MRAKAWRVGWGVSYCHLRRNEFNRELFYKDCRSSVENRCSSALGTAH